MVLDEPNANLDHEGESALTQAITSVRMRGGICIVVAHRPERARGSRPGDDLDRWASSGLRPER